MGAANSADAQGAPSVRLGTTTDTFQLGDGRSVGIPRGTIARGPVDGTVLRTPIELMAKLAFAKVTVDGQTGWFIIDTGNPVLILNTAHVKPGPVIDSAFVTDGVGHTTPVYVHRVGTFEWGGGTLKDVGAIGMDLSAVEHQIEQALAGKPVLGMIGLAQLSHAVAVFDYMGKEIVFYPFPQANKKAKSKLPPGAATVVLTTTPGGAFIKGVVDSVSLFKIDSGDDSMGIDIDLVASLGTRVRQSGKTDPIIGVGGVITKTAIVTLDSIMIGSFALKNVEMRAHPVDPRLGALGTLGSTFFSRNRVGIDVPNKKMYVWAL